MRNNNSIELFKSLQEETNSFLDSLQSNKINIPLDYYIEYEDRFVDKNALWYNLYKKVSKIAINYIKSNFDCSMSKEDLIKCVKEEIKIYKYLEKYQNHQHNEILSYIEEHYENKIKKEIEERKSNFLKEIQSFL